MPEPSRPASRIVVGVDGSEQSLDALRWAAGQARLSGAQLHVVTGWFYPEFPTPFGIVPELPPPDPMDEARRRLDETVAAVLGASPNIVVHAEVIKGSPAAVLLDAAERADLLVVGSRGMGRFDALLLGSVCERCVRLATCPVVVIHRTKHPGDLPSLRSAR
jgi:nucleotide-binding universal stress UspA family protein